MTAHVRLDAYVDATPADPGDPDTPIAVSAFAGVGGFDLGLEAAGVHTAVQIEWDAAASRVLAARFPDAARFSDVREVTADAVSRALGGRRPDVLVGGFPCQDLSVAGRRAGLAGERSGLYGELLRLARDLDPDWLVVENVPGLLSSAGGDGDALDEYGARAEGEGDDADGGAGPVPVRPGAGVRGSDFALFLGDLTGFEPAVPSGGWRSSGVAHGPRGTCAWRVLDAQHFGVAQRRRRVFVVFHPRDGAAPAAVLLEPEGVRRHPASGRPPRPRASRPVGDAAVRLGVVGAGGAGEGGVRPGGLGDDGRGPADAADLTSTLQGGGQRGWRLGAEEAAGGQVVPVTNALEGDVARALMAAGSADPHDASQSTYVADRPAMVESGQGFWTEAERAATLRVGGDPDTVVGDHGDEPGVLPVAGALTRSSHTMDDAGVGGGQLVPYAVSGGGGEDADLRAAEVDRAETLTTRGAWAGTQGGTLAVGHDPDDISPTVTSKWAKHSGGPAGNETGNLVATPLLEVGARTGTSTDDPRAGIGVGEPGDPMFTLQASKQHGIGVDVYNGETTGDLAHTVRGGHDQGVPRVIDAAMGVTAKGNGEAYLSEQAPTLAGQGGMPGQGYAAVVQRDAYEVDKERGLPNDEGISVKATEVAPTITADGDPTERTDRGLRIVEPAAYSVTPGGHRDGDGWGGFEDAPLAVRETDVATTLTGDAGTTRVVEPGVDRALSSSVATYRKSKRAQTDQDDETWVEADRANTLNTHDNAADTRATEIVVEEPVAFHAQQDPTGSAVSPTISGGQGSSPVGVAIPINADALRGPGAAATPSPDAEGRVRLRDPGLGVGEDGDPAGTLAAAGPGAVGSTRPVAAVRRLTPTECERLQGFPDGWTDVEGTSDSARYKQLGNAVAVPVAAWVAWRIQCYRRGLLTW